MIVDDHQDGAAILGQLLGLQGFDISVITDSGKALDQARDFRPHFIILDLAMPHLSGYELCKLIRQQPELEHVPVIALSGYADKEHARMALEAGCDYHLPKPLDSKEFHRIIASELEKRGPGLGGFFVKA